MESVHFPRSFEHISRAYAEVYAAAQMAQWYYDDTNGIQYFSKSYSTIFELANEDELVSETLINKIHPDDKERVLKVLEYARKHKSSFNLIYRILLPEGKLKYIKAHGKCARLSEKEVMYGVVLDITEMEEQRNRVHVLADNLMRSNRDLEQFAFVASHDLQEPLRKIRAFGDLLLNNATDELSVESQFYIERMRDASERMQTLIEDLLIFSRLSMHEVRHQPVDLNLIVNEIIEGLRELLLDTKATVAIEGLTTVEGNESLLRQLFQNLISNALKFTRENIPLKLEITGRLFRAVEAPWLNNREKADVLEIIIKDNGIGFDQKHANKIFDLFGRLHNHNKYKGTGIGLALCKKVVEYHQGLIQAESEVDKGAKFKILLPIKQQPQ
ncbi:PAS domain-containing protein [bacterium]|nr:PAS domain-containing protein [bacterium]